MKRYLFILFIVCAGTSLSAQQATTTNTNKETTPKTVSLAIGAGTQGLGINAKMQLHPKWFIRLGASDLPIDYSGAIKISGYNTHMHLATAFTNAHLLAEWQPFASWLRFVGGVSYFFTADIKGTITLKNAKQFGDYVLQPSDVGEIDTKIGWEGVAPYLGINLLKAQPAKRVNVNIDLGTYYFLSQQVSMSGTKLLSGNDANTAQLKSNLNGYRWLPVLQFNFNYKITK